MGFNPGNCEEEGTNPHIGSDFDELLEEDGIKEEVEKTAKRRAMESLIALGKRSKEGHKAVADFRHRQAVAGHKRRQQAQKGSRVPRG